MSAYRRARRAYEALRRVRPEWFRNESGGIEILSDPALVTSSLWRMRCHTAAREARGSRGRYWWARLRHTVRPEPVGVVSADRFLFHLRDPVRFPDGALGLYNRIVPPPGATPGVVVLPLVGPDRKILLLEHYRHATRDWHWEVVRGFGDPGASAEENVARELEEEVSAHPRQTLPLGELHPDTGLLAQHVQLFAARVESVGELERHEGIRRAIVVSCAEAEEMVRTGDITDAFTIAVLYRARLAGLFD